MSAQQTCLLCGFVGPDVRTALVSWRQPVAGRQYEAVPRCTDTEACRARLEQQREEWPLGRAEQREEVPA